MVLVPAPPPALDVPPLEEKWVPPLPQKPDSIISGPGCAVISEADTSNMLCIGGKIYELVRRRTCADKSRFLLMSEDGKWHCISFEGLKQ
jgi:hypothetical protein